MLEQNPETIKIVFKHFPLRFHKEAVPAAMAAMAAHAQGKFWEFHNEIFALKSNEFSAQKYKEIAEKLGLEMERFQADAESPLVRAKIFSDMNNGQKAGVNSTPTLFINGWKYQDQRTPQIMQEKINEELAKIKAQEMK